MTNPHSYGRVPYQLIDSGAVAKMTAGDVKTLLVICAHANKDNVATPGVRRLAALSGLNVGTVSRAINRLQTLGAIDIQTKGNGHRNTYRVNISACSSANGVNLEPYAPAQQTVCASANETALEQHEQHACMVWIWLATH